jgi:hypothetical protein
VVWILLIGAIVAIINVVLTYTELIPFFKAFKQLNSYTSNNPSFKNRMAYPFRFITILPKLMPLVLDGTIAAISGGIGLGGGVYGALIGLTLGFTASLMVKVHKHFIEPKIKTEVNHGWKIAN